MDSDAAFKSEKRRVFKEVITIFLVVGLVTAGIFGFGVYWLFYDMGRLPEGDFLTEEPSPDGTYTVRAYVANGGATVPYSVRGELVFNKKEGKTKTIYWNDREESAHLSWKDDDTVIINGHTLDVPGDRFDFRHD
jgi:Family of unknown function (DUF5412)